MHMCVCICIYIYIYFLLSSLGKFRSDRQGERGRKRELLAGFIPAREFISVRYSVSITRVYNNSLIRS